MLLKQVWITTSFEGWHRWENAPDTAEYLRDWHRHLFHVKLSKIVTGNDREIEFIDLKHAVDAYLEHNYTRRSFNASCEQIAEDLLDQFNAHQVTVSEDGENGATITNLALPRKDA